MVSEKTGKRNLSIFLRTFAGIEHALNPVSVGGQLRFEGLVLLVLALDVSRILVRLFRGGLEFLRNPVLHFIGVPRELLQGLRLAQTVALLNHGLLQSLPTVQDIHPLAVNFRRRVMTTADQLVGKLVHLTNLLLLRPNRLVEILQDEKTVENLRSWTCEVCVYT